MGGALATGVLAATLYGGNSAGADPAALPTTAGEAVQKMIDLSRESEQLNQQALGVQADLDAKLAIQRETDSKLAASTAVADTARGSAQIPADGGPRSDRRLPGCAHQPAVRRAGK
nr:hypothetical protein [Nocardia australiensis]